jgi:hypothetical protein
MANGYMAYRGPSMLDGKPIKVLVTGDAKPSANAKTGDMLQTWILAESSKPSEAVHNGDDKSICGDCKFRPINGGECYVETGKAPNSVFKAQYPTEPVNNRNVPVRLGAYGDPAAVPLDVLQGIVDRSPRHTGYTHQWRDNPALAVLAMASVDSESEYQEATSKGWRTFRVRKSHEPILDGEVSCPASKEAGNRTTCDKCGLCAGTSLKAKNVTIIKH